jgi:parallel beta-helix repeat protein
MRKRNLAVAVFLCALLLPAVAQAANLKVNCSQTGESEDQPRTITAALKRLNPIGPNTVTVSGACHENIAIQSFDRLTLIANPGASINDASGGNDFVIFISDSQRITIQAFTVSGGGGGIACVSHSLCRFSGNTVQGSAGDGIEVNSSHGELSGDTIQNHASRGLVVIFGGQAHAVQETIQNNGASGIRVTESSYLSAVGNTIRNNGFFGIRVTDHSSALISDSSITANVASGVGLESGSEGDFSSFVTGNTITGNAGNGVSINDLSFANFVFGNNISGNTTQPDVACKPQFSAERGALPTSNIGGGTTNCVEP